MVNYIFGHATGKQVHQSPPAVRSHRDHISFHLTGKINNRICFYCVISDIEGVITDLEFLHELLHLLVCLIITFEIEWCVNKKDMKLCIKKSLKLLHLYHPFILPEVKGAGQYNIFN